MSQKAQRREFDHMAGDISPEGHEEQASYQPKPAVPLFDRTAPKAQYPDKSRKARRKAVLITEAVNSKIDYLCTMYFDDLAAFDKSLLNVRGDGQPTPTCLEWEKVQRDSHREHRLSVYNGQWRSWLRASPKSYDYLKSEGMFLKRVVALTRAMSSANETPDITSE